MCVTHVCTPVCVCIHVRLISFDSYIVSRFFKRLRVVSVYVSVYVYIGLKFVGARVCLYVRFRFAFIHIYMIRVLHSVSGVTLLINPDPPCIHGLHARTFPRRESMKQNITELTLYNIHIIGTRIRLAFLFSFSHLCYIYYFIITLIETSYSFFFL